METNALADPTLVLTSNGYRLSTDPRRLGRLEPVPAAEREERPALLERFDRDGYLFLPGFLDPAVVLRFRRHYFATLAPSGLTRTGADPAAGVAADQADVDRAMLRRVLFHDIVPGPEYEALCRNPAIVGFFQRLLGAEEIHLHRRKIIRHVGPGESGIGTATQAHYDLVYLREGTDQVVSAWVPLGDCPVAQGPLIYLEGSHRRVRRDEAAGVLRRPAASMTADLPALADEYDTRWLVGDLAAGDLLVHNAHIIHASLDNRDPGGRLRLSTDIRYQAATETIDQRWQRDWHDRDGL